MGFLFHDPCDYGKRDCISYQSQPCRPMPMLLPWQRGILTFLVRDLLMGFVDGKLPFALS